MLVYTFRTILCFTLVCCATLTVVAQSTVDSAAAKAGSPIRSPLRGELQTIVIEGCVESTPEQIMGIIESRESESNFSRNITRVYYTNLKRNPSTPKPILVALSKVYKSLQADLRYYNPKVASDDSAAILAFFNQNGFHNASVQYSFYRDKKRKSNTLKFSIVEGERAVIDTLIVSGFEKVDSSISANAYSMIASATRPFYAEIELENIAKSVTRYLQDNGYYKANYEQPVVNISADGLHDTLLIIFNPGIRVRIGTITFEEFTDGYPSVNIATRRRQLDFEENEWYNKTKIEQSRANLMSLGTFDIASIDTVSVDTLMNKGISPTDSVVHFRVFTKNAKVYDVGANLLLYQTSIDNYLNAGIGLSAQYKNVFGGAQVASVSTQYVVQDLNRAFQRQYLETEALFSVVLGWPSVAKFFGNRIGFTTNMFYSLRNLVNPFRLESYAINAKAPISLFSYTYFNGLDLNIGFERQIPLNFENALNSALEEANSNAERAFVLSTFNQFSVLRSYLNGGSLLTGVFAGVALRGEHRDNPINPTKGSYSNISAEYGTGAGKFLRLQVFNTTVNTISKKVVLATKVRAGHIFLLEFSRGSAVDTNTYVPLERQFFAGGAASIRSFPSRLLHDPNSGTLTTSPDAVIDEGLYSNVIGSATLIELGLEFRYTFPRPRGFGDLWGGIIEKSGITFFMDVGNAFNRLTVQKYGTATLSNLITGSVIAAGLGYRFDTPVGPFRIDYATSVYDPTRTTGRWITNGRENVIGFSNWQLSVGLGHAF